MFNLKSLGQKLSRKDVEPTTFDIFLRWLYARILVNKNGEKYGENNYEEFPFMELLNLCTFAERYRIPQFNHDVSKVFVANTYKRVLTIESFTDIQDAMLLRVSRKEEISAWRIYPVDIWAGACGVSAPQRYNQNSSQRILSGWTNTNGFGCHSRNYSRSLFRVKVTQ